MWWYILIHLIYLKHANKWMVSDMIIANLSLWLNYTCLVQHIQHIYCDKNLSITYVALYVKHIWRCQYFSDFYYLQYSYAHVRISKRYLIYNLFMILSHFFFRMAHYIIIATDSRGSYLNTYIRQHQALPRTNYHYQSISTPGATLQKLSQKIDQHFTSIPPFILTIYKSPTIMIAAGICNLTTKLHHANGPKISYTPTPNKA